MSEQEEEHYEFNSNDFIPQEEVMEDVSKRIEKYESLNFFERFAMYMGVAQLLEIGLKNVLESKFDLNQETMEKWTLGIVKKELEQRNVRADFTSFMATVVEKRNYIAHELLADQATFNAILDSTGTDLTSTKFDRILSKAVIELEQLCFAFDHINETDGWVEN